MNEELVIAGFGGQGVLSIGKILAYSGIYDNKEVSWMPSYGPEMRGGAANVTVIISDEPVSSPVLLNVDTAIILNQQSMDKFESLVKPGGVLIFDPNGIVIKPTRKDIKIYTVDATGESKRQANARIFNMLVLGAFLKIKPIISIESVLKGLKASIPSLNEKALESNRLAIEKGAEIISEFKG